MPVKFDIHPLQRFAGKSQPLKRPREITSFSYDINRQWHHDDRSLQYYYPPSLPANLSAGFDAFVQHDDNIDEHLDGLLKAVMAHEQKNNQRLKPEVLTWRGIITKIMSAPYDRFNSFDLNATLFQGTIFIEENHVVQHKKKVAQTQKSPNQALMCYWGYKFEALSLIPTVWAETSREHIESRHEHVVNNIQQYCSVVQTGIGTTNLIIGGEVDAIWDQKPLDKDEPINWIELKTSEEIDSDQAGLKFERKLLKFWIQSFLLGVPKIIVGFRSKTGTLLRLEELATQSIPKTVKQRGNSWDGNTSVNFTASFLEFLRSTITSEGIWNIRRIEQSPNIEISKLQDVGTGQILLPDFVAWRSKLFAEEIAQLLAHRSQ